MKTKRFPIILVFTILAGLLLSACTGGTIYNSWPGLSAGQGVVYLSYQTAVFAVDTANGTLKWRFPAKAENGKSFYAAPAVTDTQIVVGDYANTLYGLDPSGTQKWAYTQDQGHYVASPLVTGDTILAPLSNYSMRALDLNGNPRWKFISKNVLWAQPVSDGKTIYVPAMDHNLYALNLSDGEEVWRKDLGAAMMNSAILDNEVLYADTMDGQVYAISTAGEILWTVETGEKVWAPLTLHEGVLYFGSYAGTVYAVDTQAAGSDRILWKVALNSPIIGGAAVTPDGLIFVTEGDAEGGAVQAISFSGEKLWSQPVSGKLYTTPVIVDEAIIVAITQGDALLTAFNFTGAQKWIFTLPK